MRQRILKPSFFTNEDLARLAPLVRIIFQGTWGEADRDGRLEDRPERLKVLIVPFDRVDMNDALQELHDAGFLTRYEAGGRCSRHTALGDHLYGALCEPVSATAPRVVAECWTCRYGDALDESKEYALALLDIPWRPGTLPNLRSLAWHTAKKHDVQPVAQTPGDGQGEGT